MRKTICFIFFLLLSFLTPVEEGVLDLRVTDVTGQTVRNIGITCGERCATAYTDDAGRARLKLPPASQQRPRGRNAHRQNRQTVEGETGARSL